MAIRNIFNLDLDIIQAEMLGSSFKDFAEKKVRFTQEIAAHWFLRFQNMESLENRQKLLNEVILKFRKAEKFAQQNSDLYIEGHIQKIKNAFREFGGSNKSWIASLLDAPLVETLRFKNGNFHTLTNEGPVSVVNNGRVLMVDAGEIEGDKFNPNVPENHQTALMAVTSIVAQDSLSILLSESKKHANTVLSVEKRKKKKKKKESVQEKQIEIKLKKVPALKPKETHEYTGATYSAKTYGKDGVEDGFVFSMTHGKLSSKSEKGSGQYNYFVNKKIAQSLSAAGDQRDYVFEAEEGLAKQKIVKNIQTEGQAKKLIYAANLQTSAKFDMFKEEEVVKVKEEKKEQKEQKKEKGKNKKEEEIKKTNIKLLEMPVLDQEVLAFRVIYSEEKIHILGITKGSALLGIYYPAVSEEEAEFQLINKPSSEETSFAIDVKPGGILIPMSSTVYKNLLKVCENKHDAVANLIQEHLALLPKTATLKDYMREVSRLAMQLPQQVEKKYSRFDEGEVPKDLIKNLKEKKLKQVLKFINRKLQSTKKQDIAYKNAASLRMIITKLNKRLEAIKGAYKTAKSKVEMSFQSKDPTKEDLKEVFEDIQGVLKKITKLLQEQEQEVKQGDFSVSALRLVNTGSKREDFKKTPEAEFALSERLQNPEEFSGKLHKKKDLLKKRLLKKTNAEDIISTAKLLKAQLEEELEQPEESSKSSESEVEFSFPKERILYYSNYLKELAEQATRLPYLKNPENKNLKQKNLSSGQDVFVTLLNVEFSMQEMIQDKTLEKKALYSVHDVVAQKMKDLKQKDQLKHKFKQEVFSSGLKSALKNWNPAAKTFRFFSAEKNPEQKETLRMTLIDILGNLDIREANGFRLNLENAQKKYDYDLIKFIEKEPYQIGKHKYPLIINEKNYIEKIKELSSQKELIDTWIAGDVINSERGKAYKFLQDLKVLADKFGFEFPKYSSEPNMKSLRPKLHELYEKIINRLQNFLGGKLPRSHAAVGTLHIMNQALKYYREKQLGNENDNFETICKDYKGKIKELHLDTFNVAEDLEVHNRLGLYDEKSKKLIKDMYNPKPKEKKKGKKENKREKGKEKIEIHESEENSSFISAAGSRKPKTFKKKTKNRIKQKWKRPVKKMSSGKSW